MRMTVTVAMMLVLCWSGNVSGNCIFFIIFSDLFWFSQSPKRFSQRPGVPDRMHKTLTRLNNSSNYIDMFVDWGINFLGALPGWYSNILSPSSFWSCPDIFAGSTWDIKFLDKQEVLDPQENWDRSDKKSWTNLEAKDCEQYCCTSDFRQWHPWSHPGSDGKQS